MKWQKVSFYLRHDSEPMDLMQRILNSLPAFSEVHSFTVEHVMQKHNPHPAINWWVVSMLFLAGFAVGMLLGVR